jgi:hypothetical protein
MCAQAPAHEKNMLHFISAFVLLVQASPQQTRTPVLVMPVERSVEITAATADAVQSVIAAELSRSKSLDVVSSKDIERLLNLSADRQLLSCTSTDKACSMEIAAALGARHLVTAYLGRSNASNMNAEFIVATLTLLDAENGVSLSRERILARTPLEVAERVRFVAGRLAARLSGEEPKPLPPLVATRQMSDVSVLAGASAVGATVALVSSLGVLPFAVKSITSPFFATPDVLWFITPVLILPVPFIAGITAAIASLLVDMATDEPMNVPRALLTAALASGSAFFIVPVVLGSASFAAFLAYTFLVGQPRTPEESAVRENTAWAAAGLASPIAGILIALMTTAGVTLGVGLFDEERIIIERATDEPEPTKGATSNGNQGEMAWMFDHPRAHEGE